MEDNLKLIKTNNIKDNNNNKNDIEEDNNEENRNIITDIFRFKFNKIHKLEYYKKNNYYILLYNNYKNNIND